MPTKILIDEEVLKRVHGETWNATETAKRLGLDRRTVAKNLKRLGMPTERNLVLKPDAEATIRGMAEQKKSLSAVAKALGVSKSSVWNYAMQWGIQFEDRYHKGYTVNDRGYRLVRKPDHPRASLNGYVREHILVAEAHLNRFLTEDEVVHHKDGDRQNNAIENLQVMTRSDHVHLHVENGDIHFGRGT